MLKFANKDQMSTDLLKESTNSVHQFFPPTYRDHSEILRYHLDHTQAHPHPKTRLEGHFLKPGSIALNYEDLCLDNWHFTGWWDLGESRSSYVWWRTVWELWVLLPRWGGEVRVWWRSILRRRGWRGGLPGWLQLHRCQARELWELAWA